MTPLERLLLSHTFECEPDGDGRRFFAEQGPSTMIFLTRAELEAALASSPAVESAAHLYVTEQLAAADADAVEIDLDLSRPSRAFFFQDIDKRAKKQPNVSVVTAFTCSKMRPDGFGGMAVLITRDAIVGKSTNDLLEDFLAEALDDAERSDWLPKRRAAIATADLILAGASYPDDAPSAGDASAAPKCFLVARMLNRFGDMDYLCAWNRECGTTTSLSPARALRFPTEAEASDARDRARHFVPTFNDGRPIDYRVIPIAL
jgi:hypothetical protein